MSAYGAWPAQIWVPMGVFEGIPTVTFGRAGTPGLAFLFHAEEDDTQPSGEEFGFIMMQSS